MTHSLLYRCPWGLFKSFILIFSLFNLNSLYAKADLYGMVPQSRDFKATLKLESNSSGRMGGTRSVAEIGFRINYLSSYEANPNGTLTQRVFPKTIELLESSLKAGVFAALIEYQAPGLSVLEVNTSYLTQLSFSKKSGPIPIESEQSYELNQMFNSEMFDNRIISKITFIGKQNKNYTFEFEHHVPGQTLFDVTPDQIKLTADLEREVLRAYPTPQLVNLLIGKIFPEVSLSSRQEKAVAHHLAGPIFSILSERDEFSFESLLRGLIRRGYAYNADRNGISLRIVNESLMEIFNKQEFFEGLKIFVSNQRKKIEESGGGASINLDELPDSAVRVLNEWGQRIPFGNEPVLGWGANVARSIPESYDPKLSPLMEHILINDLLALLQTTQHRFAIRHDFKTGIFTKDPTVRSIDRDVLSDLDLVWRRFLQSQNIYMSANSPSVGLRFKSILPTLKRIDALFKVYEAPWTEWARDRMDSILNNSTFFSDYRRWKEVQFKKQHPLRWRVSQCLKSLRHH